MSRTRMLRRGIWIGAAVLVALPACKREEKPPPIDRKHYVDPGELPAPIGDSPSVDVGLLFVDVTEAAGISFQHYNGAFGAKWMPETIGGGGGFVDYDSDGDPDVLLIDGTDWPGHETSDAPHTPHLYQNDGHGRFREVTTEVGLDAVSFYGMGLAAADYDANGEVDLFLTGVGRNYLLAQQDGRFQDVTGKRVQPDPDAHAQGAPPDWSLGAAWLDYDLDGDLDLAVVNYVQWTPETDIYVTMDGEHKSYATPQTYKGQTSRLYRNEGNGTLVEVTSKVGMLRPTGKGMGLLVDDFDDDGRPDLFITNDTEPNYLYMNREGGVFEEVARSAACGFDENGRARAGMGVDSADLTGEGSGRISMAIGNFSKEPVSLYQLQPQRLLFVDSAGTRRLSRPTLTMLTFGLVFADFNLDGRPDMMLANGHIEPTINTIQSDVTFEQPAQLFSMNAEGQFEDVSARVGEDFQTPVVGRSLSYADIDGDGDLDVLMTANSGRPRLLRNELPAPHRSIRIRLKDGAGNQAGIGAIVYAQTPDCRQRRMIRTGGSFLAQSELVATFGLGSAGEAHVHVQWPDGTKEDLGAVAAGSTYLVEQRQGIVQTTPFAGGGE